MGVQDTTCRICGTSITDLPPQSAYCTSCYAAYEARIVEARAEERAQLVEYRQAEYAEIETIEQLKDWLVLHVPAVEAALTGED